MTNKKIKRGRPKIIHDSFTVKFSLDAYLKVKKFCELAGDDEWLGFLIKDSQRTNGSEVVVNDIYFPPQSISGASVHLKAEDFTEEIANLIKTEEGRKLLPLFCGWIHSHNTMATFYSATDEEANDRMRQYMPQSKVFLSLVVNNEMQFLGKAIIKTNKREHEVDKVIFSLDYSKLESINRQCKNLFKKAEKEKIVSVAQTKAFYGYGGYGYRTYNSYYQRDNTPKVPRKFIGSMDLDLVRKVIDRENKVIMLKRLSWNIKDFIKKHRIKNKNIRKAVDFLFRALYHRKVNEEQAIQIFAKTSKKKKVRDNYIPRDLQHRRLPVHPRVRKAWEQEFIDESFEEYQRRKQEEEDYHGFY